MRQILLYIIACAIAGLMPFAARLAPADESDAGVPSFPGWPTHFEGHSLTELPLTARELRFQEDFPGRIARFTDGRREIVIRWVTTPTRKLHPASDCFAGIGYDVRPLPLYLDPDGVRWSRFAATRGEEKLRVSERIHDSADHSWTDVSAWYWSALGGETVGPWWAVTVAETDNNVQSSQPAK